MHARPTGLTVLCILGLLLASLGGLVWLTTGFGLAMQVLGKGMMFMPATPPSPAGGFDPTPFMRDIEAVQQRWLPVNIGLWAWQLLTLGLLVIGTIAAYRLTRNGRKWMLAAMVNGILFEVARVWPMIAIQRETSVLTQRMMESMARSSGGPPGFAGPMTTAMFQTMGMVSILGVAAFLLLKLSYYGGGAWYMASQSMRDYFEGPSAPPSVEPVE